MNKPIFVEVTDTNGLPRYINIRYIVEIFWYENHSNWNIVLTDNTDIELEKEEFDKFMEILKKVYL